MTAVSNKVHDQGNDSCKQEGPCRIDYVVVLIDYVMVQRKAPKQRQL